MATQLLNAAESWIGHGKWQIEPGIIDWNDTNRDKFTEFMIMFADYSNGLSQQEVLRSYINKTMTMNCWQFVLLCMYEARLIDRSDICKLYYHSDQLLKAVPLLFDVKYTKKEQPIQGDIILYAVDNKLQHAAICSSVTDIDIEIIDICDGPIRKISEAYVLALYDFKETHYLDLERVVATIKNLSPIDKDDGWIYNWIFDKSLCVFAVGLVCGYLGCRYVEFYTK